MSRTRCLNGSEQTPALTRSEHKTDSRTASRDFSSRNLTLSVLRRRALVCTFSCCSYCEHGLNPTRSILIERNFVDIRVRKTYSEQRGGGG